MKKEELLARLKAPKETFPYKTKEMKERLKVAKHEKKVAALPTALSDWEERVRLHKFYTLGLQHRGKPFQPAPKLPYSMLEFSSLV